MKMFEDRNPAVHSVQYCVCWVVSICQSVFGSGPQCGFNPTLPWPSSKDNEVPEVGALKWREEWHHSLFLWSALRHMAPGERKLLVLLQRETDTVFTDCWKAAGNIYFTTIDTRKYSGWEQRNVFLVQVACFVCVHHIIPCAHKWLTSNVELKCNNI